MEHYGLLSTNFLIPSKQTHYIKNQDFLSLDILQQKFVERISIQTTIFLEIRLNIQKQSESMLYKNIKGLLKHLVIYTFSPEFL